MKKRLGLCSVLLIVVIQLTGCTLLRDEKKLIPRESEVMCYFNQHQTNLQAAADILLNHSEQFDKVVDESAFDTWLFTSGSSESVNHLIDSVVSDIELDEIQAAWASLDVYPGSMVMYHSGLTYDTPAITHTIFKYVYIESHSMTDICQMAGRLRHGAENVYIILDSQGHPPSESRFDNFFAERICQHKLEDANQPPVQVHLLDNMLREVRRRAAEKAQVSSPEVTPCAFVDELPDVKAFIDYARSKTPYLMYDYFTGTFRVNVYRK